MKGQCLCGDVTVEIADNSQVNACHCNNCRHWGGGAGFVLGAENPNIQGEFNIKAYASSAWGTRNFCQNCGTHLFFHLNDTAKYFVSAGLFDDQDFSLTAQTFIDKKACYYELANDTPKLTESEFLAMQAGK